MHNAERARTKGSQALMLQNSAFSRNMDITADFFTVLMPLGAGRLRETEKRPLPVRIGHGSLKEAGWQTAFSFRTSSHGLACPVRYFSNWLAKGTRIFLGAMRIGRNGRKKSSCRTICFEESLVPRWRSQMNKSLHILVLLALVLLLSVSLRADWPE